MSDSTPEDDGNACMVDDHVSDVADGCGCTEIWEHLSEQREQADD